ncbi:immunoglobulin-like domain-containing protein [Schleiferilactobacillus perolens]|uniref:DUF5011 domain-containing protein n=1 Tax=Schleiferilactobacillus perolens DSM 12744 TaxID=1423792 RepID=A0A0R1MU10_9LACO|nr:immunoglobulin-like domain-containing protein [Schleiferilactobacillus perolens]KRL11671.1 hypothetical protein FD09_GL000593 [Schleiferilactobacillus perolens DSM 12744]
MTAANEAFAEANKAIEDATAKLDVLANQAKPLLIKKEAVLKHYNDLIKERDTYPEGSAMWNDRNHNAELAMQQITAPFALNDQIKKITDQEDAINQDIVTKLDPAFDDAKANQTTKQDAVTNATNDYNHEVSIQQPKIDQANKDITSANDAFGKMQGAVDYAKNALDQAKSARQSIMDTIAQGEDAHTDATNKIQAEGGLMDQKSATQVDLAKAQDQLAGYDVGVADAKAGNPEKDDSAIDGSSDYKGTYHLGYAAQKAESARTDLQTAINKGKDLIQNHAGEYTADSIAKLQQAVTAGQGVLDNADATTKALTDATTVINNAISALAKKPGTPVTPPVTYPTPEFDYAGGFVKDPTINQGATFDPNAGISAWTDSSKTTAIPAADWTVTGSVDVNKPGTYTLTYTIKNGYNQTATLTRTITVKAGESTGIKFNDIDKVIYVQASNASQYSYDANTGKFSKSDALASLAMASGWKTGRQAITVDGVTYYQVGANGWLNGIDVTTARMVEEAGILSVTNGAGAQTVNNAADGKSVKTLNSGSAWKYFASANGYYLVANNEWVKGDDVRTVAVAAQGTFKAGNNGAALYDEAGNAAGRTLGANTAWKVNGLKYIGGQAYYQVATHLYVKAAAGAQVYTTGNQPVQLFNRDGNAIGSVLGARTSWKVSSVYSHQGHVYYQVATNQFVRVY